MSENNETGMRKLIIVPWLEGGGAQGALEGLLRVLGRDNVALVILFRGSRNHESTMALVEYTWELECSRSIFGAIRASQKLKPLLNLADSVYSLMRASHLVLGLIPRKVLSDKKLAASFHQLPSQDSASLQGKIEDILVRRGVKSAGLLTAPATRAVEELIERKFGTPVNTRLEHNLLKVSSSPPVPPRAANLASLNLVFAGRITRQKGLDQIPDLLRAAELPVHLVCLGDGEDRTEIETLLKSVNAPHKVELLPYVTDITPYLDWSDAVLMPSRWELNPLVVWEARARGRGTIASALDVFKDLSESGPIWTFHDDLSFAAILRKLATDPAVRNDAYITALDSYMQLNTRSSIVEYLEV